MGQSHMDHWDKEEERDEEAYEEGKLGEAVVAAEDGEGGGGVDEDEVVVDVGKGTAGQTDEGVEKEGRGLKAETVDAVDETQTAAVQANFLPVAAAEQMPLQQHSHVVVLVGGPLIFTMVLFPLLNGIKSR